jgi:hypothetical protein
LSWGAKEKETREKNQKKNTADPPHSIKTQWQRFTKFAEYHTLVILDNDVLVDDGTITGLATELHAAPDALVLMPLATKAGLGHTRSDLNKTALQVEPLLAGTADTALLDMLPLSLPAINAVLRQRPAVVQPVPWAAAFCFALKKNTTLEAPQFANHVFDPRLHNLNQESDLYQRTVPFVTQSFLVHHDSSATIPRTRPVCSIMFTCSFLTNVLKNLSVLSFPFFFFPLLLSPRAVVTTGQPDHVTPRLPWYAVPKHERMHGSVA